MHQAICEQRDIYDESRRKPARIMSRRLVNEVALYDMQAGKSDTQPKSRRNDGETKAESRDVATGIYSV